MNMLQRSLLANAIFSFISGLSMALFHHELAESFQIMPDMVFWIIGLGLTVFSITVFIEYFKLRVLQVKLIIIQDLLWVFGSLLMIFWNPFEISAFGTWLIAGVMVIVFIFSLLQYFGLKKVIK